MSTTLGAELARQQAIEGSGINPPPACYTNGQPRNALAPGRDALARHVGKRRSFGRCQKRSVTHIFAIHLLRRWPGCEGQARGGL
jgi:hypothetical protein